MVLNAVLISVVSPFIEATAAKAIRATTSAYSTRSCPSLRRRKFRKATGRVRILAPFKERVGSVDGSGNYIPLKKSYLSSILSSDSGVGGAKIVATFTKLLANGWVAVAHDW